MIISDLSLTTHKEELYFLKDYPNLSTSINVEGASINFFNIYHTKQSTSFVYNYGVCHAGMNYVAQGIKPSTIKVSHFTSLKTEVNYPNWDSHASLQRYYKFVIEECLTFKNLRNIEGVKPPECVYAKVPGREEPIIVGLYIDDIVDMPHSLLHLMLVVLRNSWERACLPLFDKLWDITPPEKRALILLFYKFFKLEGEDFVIQHPRGHVFCSNNVDPKCWTSGDHLPHSGLVGNGRGYFGVNALYQGKTNTYSAYWYSKDLFENATFTNNPNIDLKNFLKYYSSFLKEV